MGGGRQQLKATRKRAALFVPLLCTLLKSVQKKHSSKFATEESWGLFFSSCVARAPARACVSLSGLSSSPGAPGFASWAVGFGFVLRDIPRFVYGGMLVELGLDYIETYLVLPLWRKRSMDAVDAATLLAIVAVAMFTSLLEAIAVGMVFSLLGTLQDAASRERERERERDRDPQDSRDFEEKKTHNTDT